jgi:hypothetical protein
MLPIAKKPTAQRFAPELRNLILDKYLMISLSLNMQVDSNGGKTNPSICAERQSMNPTNIYERNL